MNLDIDGPKVQQILKQKQVARAKWGVYIYCYKVMPFGLKNAGAIYQRAMQRIFDNMLHKNVECYVDDLVVKSKQRVGHITNLRQVFGRL